MSAEAHITAAAHRREDEEWVVSVWMAGHKLGTYTYSKWNSQDHVEGWALVAVAERLADVLAA